MVTFIIFVLNILENKTFDLNREIDKLEESRDLVIKKMIKFV
jgi:hypothetical protein